MATQPNVAACVGLYCNRENFTEESLNGHTAKRGGLCSIILPDCDE